MAKAYEIAFALSSSTAKFTQGFQSASRTVARLQESFKALDGAARQSHAMAEMQAKVQAGGRAYREAVAHVQSLRQAMLASGPPTRAQAQALDKANASAQKAKETLQRTAERMRSLAQSAGVAGSGIQRFIAQESQLAQAASRAGQALARQQAIEARLGKAKAGVASAAPYAQQAGSSLGGAGQSAILAGAQFEHQISALRAVAVGGGSSTEAELKQLEAQARQLGATTKWSASQAAAGMYDLSKAGFSAKEILAAMPGLLDAATAGELTVSQAASISATTLRQFNLDASHMGHTADVLVKSALSVNMTIEDLGAAMKYAAPIAKEYGGDLETCAAMLAIVQDNGTDASMAGTAARAVMTRLTSKTKQATDALGFLGVKASDAKGNIKDFPTLLKEIAEREALLRKQGKLTEIGQARVNQALFGLEASSAGAKMLANADKIFALREKLYNSSGTSQNAARTMANDLTGDWLGLLSALESVQISIFQKVAPALRELVAKATGVARAVDAWANENPELVQTLAVAGGAVAALAAAALPCAVAVKSLAFVFGIFKVAALGVWAALGPVGLAIAAVVAAGVLLYANWEAVSAWAVQAWSAVSAAVSSFCTSAGQWLHSTWDGVAAWFAGVWAGVQASFQSILDFVTGTFTAAWSAAWASVQSIFSGMWDGLKGIAQSVLDWLIGKLNSVISMVNSTIEVMNKIPGVDIGKLDAIPTSGQKVPAMASGGIVMDPTLAMVGEGGGPEAVVPLDRLSDMLGAYSSAGREGTGGSPVTVQVTNNVTVGAGSGDVYGEVRRGLDASANDMARTLERLLQNQRRLSYA